MSTRMVITFWIYNEITNFFHRYLDNSHIYRTIFLKNN